jgi:dTDP-4-amino-4,6-dideoxygalactose transaminase
MEKTPHFQEWPIWDEEEEKLILEVLRSGKWWCGAPANHAGEQVWKFQDEFAKFNESKFAFACTNGTHAIEIALMAMDIGLGDEVIVSNWTFVASASAVVAVNAVPIFCDITTDTFLMDPEKLEKLITPKTKAIVCVHLGGMPCDMERILAIAKKHNLRVIEDCAHAHGSRYKGKRVGNWGDVGTFSFQASKIQTGGEGGAIVCNDAVLADRLYEVLDAGRHVGAWFYDHFTFGSNYRLGEFNAAIMRTQLKKFPAQHKKRNENAKYLTEKLNQIDGINVQKRYDYVDECGYYVYAVHFDGKKFGGWNNKDMYKALADAKIPTDACYPPLHTLDAFKRGKGKKGIDYSDANWGGKKSDLGNFPVVEEIHAQAFELPQELLLSDKEALDYVVQTIKALRGKFK